MVSLYSVSNTVGSLYGVIYIFPGPSQSEVASYVESWDQKKHNACSSKPSWNSDRFTFEVDQNVLRSYYVILEGFLPHREHGPRSMSPRSVVPPI